MSEPTAKSKDAIPVVTLREEPSRAGRTLVLLVPSLFGSIVVHVVLLALFFVFMLPTAHADRDAAPKDDIRPLEADESRTDKIPFTSVDEDPAAQEPGIDTNYDIPRLEKVSIPGENNPEKDVGFDGAKNRPPVSQPVPGGFGPGGPGGRL